MSINETHHQDHSANSPGAILRRCREYHGISLEEAAEATKIGTDHLTALEKDQIKGFASQAYLKGFLRIYATHLGLNADDMMRLYEKLYASPTSHDHSLNAGDSGVARRRRVPWKKLILPAVLLLMLIVTSYILDRSSTPPARRQTLPPGPGTPIAAPVQPVRSSVSNVPSVTHVTSPAPPAAVSEKHITPPERPGVAPPPAEAPKDFIVRMKVIRNGTLAVTIDGSATQNYELSVGDVIEWKADKSIILELSNAGGVEIELNGRQIKPLGPEGKPAYVTLDANGVKS
ncbi:helix-turn-helix domain-containing protein [Geobacter sp. SVR]|uniref:helix-turn-helix domain-containing protein n=1 Tax=Geobacter sp. SVR TaxID=2495594 RepID=UPI00143EFF5F|nr:helix-turn-helix domain-containing protein [Geobacter sp. SVR]BCS52072.1 DNA-binding protein [Geobacter sp. SVR]GCF86527.1 DNA-binding protein [Geobacter sp. SVR]